MKEKRQKKYRTDLERKISARSSNRPRRRGLRVLPALLCLLILAVLTGCSRKTKISVMNYVTVQAEGINGKGKAQVSFDTDQLIRDLNEKSTLTPRQEEEIRSALDSAEMDFAVSPSEGLSNGDKITVTSDMDTKLLDSYDVSISNGKETIEAEGLADELTVNLADDLIIYGGGFEGSGWISPDIDYNSLLETITGRVSELNPEVKSQDEALDWFADKNISFYSDLNVTLQMPDSDTGAGYSQADQVTVHAQADLTPAMSSAFEELGIVIEPGDYVFSVPALTPTMTVSLQDYIEVSFYGFSGQGSAGWLLNTDALEEDLLQALKEEGRGLYSESFTIYTSSRTESSTEGSLQENTEAGAETIDYESAAADLADYAENAFYTEMNTSFGDETQALKNGDTVTLTSVPYEESDSSDYSYDLTSYGLILEGFEKEYTAEGLDEMLEVDLASYLNVTGGGFEGYASAQVQFDYQGLARALRERQQIYEPEGNEYLDSLIADVESGTLPHIQISSPSDLTHLSGGETVTIQTGWTDDEEGSFSNLCAWLGVDTGSGEYAFTVPQLPGVISISLADYMGIRFQGYEESGKASWTLDEEKLEEDLTGLLEQAGRGAEGRSFAFYSGAQDQEVSQADDAARQNIDYESAADTLRRILKKDISNRNIDVSFSEGNGSLSNGDAVTMTVSAGYAETDEEGSIFLAEGGILADGFEKEYTAQDLTPLTPVKLGDYISAAFTGTAPNLSVEYTVSREGTNLLAHTNRQEVLADGPMTADIGDVIRGELTYDEDWMRTHGYQVEDASYSFTVSGVPSYILSFENSSAACLQQLMEQSLARAPLDAIDHRNDLLSAAGMADGFFKWDQISAQPYRVVYVQGSGASDLWGGYWWNRVFAVSLCSVPTLSYARESSQVQFYEVCMVTNLQEREDGSGQADEETEYYFYLNESDLDNLLSESAAQFGSDPVTVPLSEEDTARAQEAQTQSEAEADRAQTESSLAQSGEIQEQEVLTDPQIDSSALAAAAAGPVILNGHMYVRYDQIDGRYLTWDEAEAFCEKAGGHLASVTDVREQDVIDYLTSSGPVNSYWLGGTDQETEGVWTWVTGETSEFTRWADDQPDNYLEEGEYENNLEIRRDGSWNDRRNSYGENGFILEAESPDLLSADGQILSATEGCTYLDDQEPVLLSESQTGEYVTDQYGNVHFGNQAYNTDGRAVRTYHLDGAYTALDAVLSTYTDAGADVSMEMSIWGDERLLYERYAYTKDDAPQEIHLDLTGVDTLSIQTMNRGSGGNAWLFLNEALLTDAVEKQNHTEFTELSQAGILYMQNVEDYTGRGNVSDLEGNLYRNGFEFHVYSGSESEIAVSLRGKYTGLQLAMAADSYVDYPYQIRILGDGEELSVTRQFTVLDGAMDLNVDVTDVNVLQIQVSAPDTEGDSNFWIGNVFLTGSEPAAAPASEELSFPDIPAETAQLSSAVVTAGWTRYYRFDERVSAQQALEICQQTGAELAGSVLPEGAQADAMQQEEQAVIDYLVSSGSWNSYWTAVTMADFQTALESRKLSDFSNEEIYRGMILKVDSQEKPDDGQMTALEELEWKTGESCEARSDNLYDIPDGIMSKYGLVLYSGSYGRMSVNLGGAYSALSGTAVMDANAAVGADAALVIFGDGKVLWSLEHFQKGDAPVRFNVDLTGVKELRIQSASLKMEPTLYLLDTWLKKSDSVSVTDQARLSDYQLVNAENNSDTEQLFLDEDGAFYDGAHNLNAGYGGYELYNIRAEHTSFVCHVSSLSRQQEVTVTFETDSGQSAEVTLSQITGPQEVEMDISGASTLRISAALSDGTSGTDCYVAITGDSLQ